LSPEEVMAVEPVEILLVEEAVVEQLSIMPLIQ
jgi:hypothetical protein